MAKIEYWAVEVDSLTGKTDLYESFNTFEEAQEAVNQYTLEEEEPDRYSWTVQEVREDKEGEDYSDPTSFPYCNLFPPVRRYF